MSARLHASKLRTRGRRRRAARHSFATHTPTDIEIGCTFTPNENYVSRVVHTKCTSLTQMHNIGQEPSCTRSIASVCACRRRLWQTALADGKWRGENHSPSARCTDCACHSHEELIASATTILIGSILLRPRSNSEPTCRFRGECVPALCVEKQERKRNWLREYRKMPQAARSN
jgi:hypothetical protein